MKLRALGWKKGLLGASIALGVMAVAALTYYQLLKAGIVHYGRYDRRERGSLTVGATAPDLDLTMYDGARVHLSQLWGAQPLFVVFGSCT